jgi:hypothetical protein
MSSTTQHYSNTIVVLIEEEGRFITRIYIGQEGRDLSLRMESIEKVTSIS